MFQQLRVSVANEVTESHVCERRANVGHPALGRSAQDGQAPDPLPGRRINRVAQRRCNWRHWRLAGAARRFVTVHKISLNDRGFIHPDRLVIVEISLHHSAFVDRDLRPQSVGQPVNNPAADLLLENVGIDHLSGVDRRMDALHAQALADFDLGDPGGAGVAITSLTKSGASCVLGFDTLSAPGTYAWSVGPSIAALAGNPMNPQASGP